MDGAQLDFKAPPVPSKSMYTMMSIWTKNHKDFGGAVPDGHEPYFSSFAGVTRILCDLPSPRVSCAAAVWLVHLSYVAL